MRKIRRLAEAENEEHTVYQLRKTLLLLYSDGSFFSHCDGDYSFFHK